MTTHFALLCGINVSGHNMIKKMKTETSSGLNFQNFIKWGEKTKTKLNIENISLISKKQLKMKQLNYFFLLFTVLYSSFFYAQNSLKEIVINPLQKDALIREKVFIHTNKTTYFNNENIWFKAYVAIDATNSPSISTTNLIVNLLNNQGDVINSKTLFIQNGTGYGDFFLDAKLSSGKYYIQAFTNFMRNFDKANAYVQQIEVINTSIRTALSQLKDSSDIYDIQAFPESGYLLENTENVVSIKALINGKGQTYSGVIINSKGKEISSFKGNEFGFSKSIFFYDINETYKAILKFKTGEKAIDLPKANKTGIIFSVDNTSDTKLKLTLKTNIETIPTLKKDTLALLFYRNNYISEAVSIALNNNFKTTQDLFFEKNKMLYGVNIVTLFKNNVPIAERKFFIENPDDQTGLLITKINSTNDSISYKIKATDSNNNSLIADLSVAIVSEKSKIYNEQQNIKTAFLLSPYIKGSIENPAIYFSSSNMDRKAYLDLLLLSQGWTSYTLSDKIKNINPKEVYEFENGFTINGTIKKYPKNYEIGILSKQNRLAAYSKIDAASTFSFKNVFAYKNETVKIALIKKNEPLMKPNQVSFTSYNSIKENYKHLINPQTNYTIKESKQLNNIYASSYRLGNEVNQLDDVIIENSKAKKTETNFEKELNIAYKHSLIAPGFYQSKKVTAQMESTYQTLMAYLVQVGCTVKENDSGSKMLVLSEAPTTLFGQNETLGYSPAKIYIDDVPRPSFDIEKLLDLPMYEIDEILINKSGAGQGLTGMGGVINIYLKKNGHQYFDESNKNLYQNLLLLTGYDRADQYYKPLFNLTETNIDWMEINWENSLKTDINGELIIKVPTNKFSNGFTFIVNGVSASGFLLHDVYSTKFK